MLQHRLKSYHEEFPPSPSLLLKWKKHLYLWKNWPLLPPTTSPFFALFPTYSVKWREGCQNVFPGNWDKMPNAHTVFPHAKVHTYSFPLAWSDACKKRKIWQSVKFSFLSFQTFNVRSNPTPVIFEACWKTDLTFTFTHLPSPTPTSQKNREGIFRREHFFLSLSHSHKRLILNTGPTISRIATAANGPELINPWESMWEKKKRGVGKFRISRMGWEGIPKLPWGCDRLFLQKGRLFSPTRIAFLGPGKYWKKRGQGNDFLKGKADVLIQDRQISRNELLPMFSEWG